MSKKSNFPLLECCGPDPESGTFFLSLDLESGTEKNLYPGSPINNPDHIYNYKFLVADPDLRSGMENIPDPQ
jgi:hypothetical protein